MYNGIVAIDDPGLKKECSEILSKFETISVDFIDHTDEIDAEDAFNSLFFLTNKLSDNNSAVLKLLERQFPNFPVIFYNHSLMLSETSINLPRKNLYLVVGVERKEHLKKLIRRLVNGHWRRIPYEELGIDFDKLSPRMKRVMQYIETNDLQKCDIFHLSDYLNITPGYFSQLFKIEIGQSFRGFMQKVINYYENLLFLEWGLEVKNVSKLLGYSEISSYSRSFKKRKGQSPRAYAKLKTRAE
ncbi:MAG: helix-turn-helix transcriptional regulator [Calditrichaeota bacterium]|nr:helix-turn-helix transcriptional regulator [Calditrichota bacterium]